MKKNLILFGIAGAILIATCVGCKKDGNEAQQSGGAGTPAGSSHQTLEQANAACLNASISFNEALKTMQADVDNTDKQKTYLEARTNFLNKRVDVIDAYKASKGSDIKTRAASWGLMLDERLDTQAKLDDEIKYIEGSRTAKEFEEYISKQMERFVSNEALFKDFVSTTKELEKYPALAKIMRGADIDIIGKVSKSDVDRFLSGIDKQAQDAVYASHKVAQEFFAKMPAP